MFCEDVLPVKEERWNVFTKHIIIIITGIINTSSPRAVYSGV